MVVFFLLKGAMRGRRAVLRPVGFCTLTHFLLGALRATCCTVATCTSRELRLISHLASFITKGTPFQRSLFIFSTIAANVGVTESSGTPGSSKYPGSDMKLSSVYCAKKASSNEGMLIAFNTSTFAAWISLGASLAGGSMAHNTKTWRRWFCMMSRMIPVCKTVSVHSRGA